MSDYLPPEMLLHLFSFMTRNDRMTAGLVCRPWADAAWCTAGGLPARTCLRVSYRDQNGKTRLIDRQLLIDSDRRYTAFRVEWANNITEQDMRRLQEVLEVCQQRFHVQKLYLKVPVGRALTQFFTDRQKWLENLTMLHVEYCESSDESIQIELSLPKLEQLTWLESSEVVHEGFNSLCVDLDAPQLTKMVISRLDYNQFNIKHKEQIRTMVVDLDLFGFGNKVPPSNVTELYLRLIVAFGDGDNLFCEHANDNYHKLERLTVLGNKHLNGKSIVKYFPNLEHLHAHEVDFRLADFDNLANLKSLTLSDCTIHSDPDDKEVMLEALECLRVERVTVTGVQRNLFPVRGRNLEPQPMIDGQNVFSSPDFHARQWSEIIALE